MSHFYGTLKGSRGEATRCGTKKSGITTHTASWEGAVRVELYQKDGIDYAKVCLTKWRNGAGDYKLLYDGPVSGREQNGLQP